MRPKKTPYKPDPELAKTHPHLKDFFPFLHELRFESDRGAVLLCCAYLDDLLRDTIKAFFIDSPEADRLLEGFNAPLGTFSARASAAHCCGLVSPKSVTHAPSSDVSELESLFEEKSKT